MMVNVKLFGDERDTSFIFIELEIKDRRSVWKVFAIPVETFLARLRINKPVITIRERKIML